MSKIAVTFLLAIAFNGGVIAQQEINDVDGYLCNQAYKNIAAYNIRYCSFRFNGIPFKKTFYSNSDFFYNYFLADSGYKMKMKITKLNLKYPDDNFHLYEISTNGFYFVQNSGDISRGSIGPIAMDTYLIALNESNGQIKFISGQFFKSAISKDFKVNPGVPNSLIDYVRMRAFVISPLKVDFVEKKHRRLVYKIYSSKYEKKFVLKVPTKDLDDISITYK